MQENRQDTTLRKVFALLAIWVMVSVFGVLFATFSVGAVFFIKDGTLVAILQNNLSGPEKNVALISMIFGAAIGLAFAVKIWETVMKKTRFVSHQFVDKWLGEDLLPKHK